MKYKGLILFFVANEVSAATLVIGKQQAMSTMVWGAAGTALGLFILWLFIRVGMFRGLKFRHYAFIMLCITIAMTAGYYYGSFSSR
jgi:hypothetical protein